MAPVEHDDLVLVGGIIHDVPQRQQRRCVAEDGAPPGGVALMRNDKPLLVGCDGVIQGCWFLILIWGCEVVLVGRWKKTGGLEAPAPPQEKASCPPMHRAGHTTPHLVKLEGHSNPRCHYVVQQVHVGKDPLVTWGCNAEVPLEKGVQAVEEGLQAGREAAQGR